MLVFPGSSTNQEDSELLQRTINWQCEIPQCRSSFDNPHHNTRSLPSRNSNMSPCSSQMDEALHDVQEHHDLLAMYCCSSPLEFHHFFPTNSDNITNRYVRQAESSNITLADVSSLNPSRSSSECTNSATEFRPISFPSRLYCNPQFQHQQYLLYRDTISTSGSSMPTSEESTPQAFGITSNSRAQLSNPKSSLLTSDWPITDKPDSDDELFNHHMEVLMEYSLSPKKPSQYIGDSWLDYPPPENSLQHHPKMEYHQHHTGSFGTTPLSSASSHSYPSRASHENLSRFALSTASSQCCVPWFRSINRNDVFNQQRTLPEPSQSKHKSLRQSQANSRANAAIRKFRVEEKKANDSRESRPTGSNYEITLPQIKNITNRPNSDEDCETGDDDETQQEDVEIEDSEDDCEDWLASLPTRKRKHHKKGDSSPRKERKSTERAKSDHGDDDDNVVEIIDNAATKPRRKASEAARNILMNWLVENEDHPYPTKKQKLELANATGLSLKQIVHWLSNIRKRRMIPLLSGRRQASSMVDMKFLEDIYQRRNMRAPRK